MRKKIMVYALLFMLIASMAATSFVSLVKANPFVRMPVPVPSPVTDKPNIILTFPVNGTPVGENPLLTFELVIPASWYWIYPYYTPWKGTPIFLGTINRVTCTIDGTTALDNQTAFGGFSDKPESIPDTDLAIISPVIYSIPIGNLTKGEHQAAISVSAFTVYMPNGDKYATPYNYYDISANETFNFKIGSPIITCLSLENKTYDSSEIPLIFNVDKTPSWSGFSLDNQVNHTLSENVTLDGLAEGDHSIIFYANDTYGNMGTSDTILFTVSLPTPSPSPSPTQQPTPSTVGYVVGWWIPYEFVAGLIVLCVSLGILIYFKKRKIRKLRKQSFS